MKQLKRLRDEIILDTILIHEIWGLILCIKIVFVFFTCMNPTDTSKIVMGVVLFTLTILGAIFTMTKKKSSYITCLISILFDIIMVLQTLPY